MSTPAPSARGVFVSRSTLCGQTELMAVSQHGERIATLIVDPRCEMEACVAWLTQLLEQVDVVPARPTLTVHRTPEPTSARARRRRAPRLALA